MDEKRTLKVDPRLIFDVISKQAGTLGKAVMEGCMNSIDAGASRCDITLSPTTFSVRDDGKGFVDRNEIEKFFETFGTPHVKGDATYGRFRIGRGQMFSFGHNRWRSGEFFMEVDLRNRGLDYTLRQSPDDVRTGCSIEATLYDTLSPTDFDATLREVKELVAFSPIPVTLNGDTISKGRSSIKWDYEDDDCLISLRSAGQVKVYNLGMFVRGYHAGQFGGAAAIVVSKKQLEVNFARTDILTSQCEVWKRIRRALDKLSGNRADKKQRMSVEDRQYILQKFITGQMSYFDFQTQKVFPTFPSGYTSIDAIVTGTNWKHQSLVVLGPADNDRIAEAVVRSERAKVLRNDILEWANVDDAQGLIEALIEGAKYDARASYAVEYFRKIHVSPLADVSNGIFGTHSIVHNKEWTKLERAAINAIGSCERTLMRSIGKVTGDMPKAREIRVGLSDSAQAWTDGRSFIALEREWFGECLKSLGGIGELLGTIVHEFLHDEDDSGSHIHDVTFYERFHEAMLGGAMNAQREFLRSFYGDCRKAKAAIPSSLRRELDSIFRVSLLDQDAEPETAEEGGAAFEPLAAAAA